MESIANRITEKAAELFSLYGIKRITVDEIAASAGVGKKMFASCFVNKTAVVESVVDDMINKNRMGCTLIKKQSDHVIGEMYLLASYLEKYYSLNSSFFISQLQLGYPGVAQKMKVYKLSFLTELIKENLQTGIEQRVYRHDLNVAVVAAFILQNLALIKDMGFETQEPSAENEIITQMIYGLVNANGAEKIEHFKQLHHLIKYETSGYSPLWDH